MICPQGSGGIREKIHQYGAAAYMLDHQVFCWLMGMRWVFVAGFWTCFIGFGGGTLAASQLVKSAPQDTATDVAGVKSAPQGVPLLLTDAGSHPAVHNHLWYTEVFRMLTENGMFVFFISGMLS